MNTVVELEGVGKSYPSGSVSAVALDSVDLSIAEGEFVALAGPSGSGKTTLLNLSGALDAPSSGRVRICGVDPSGLRDRALARLRNESVGFIFQSFNLVPSLTAYENAELPLRLSRKWRGARAERPGIERLLAEVGLEGLGSRFPRELSGGQRQRVAVARALAARPALVLADEPTANLDRKAGESVLRLLRALNVERGVAALFSTHDPAMMERADRIVRLDDGRVASDSKARSGDGAA